jgi:integrase
MRYVKKPAPLKNEIQALPLGRHYYGEGLVLIISPTARRWASRYTSPITHRVTETAIGPWPTYSYASARKVIAQLQAMVAKGDDPVLVKRQQRAKGTTFAEACEGWINKHKSRWRSTRHIDTLFKHGQSLADVSIQTIDRRMVINALSKLYEKHPEQVYRTVSVWSRVFDYAKTMGFREGDNPCRWRGNMENVFFRPKNGDKHHASMPFKDVPEFVQRLRLRQVKGTAAAALEFLILTACRTGEVLGMKWSEVDLVNRILTLPRERTKQDRKHRVPFPVRCTEILALQNEYRHKGQPFSLLSDDFVFQGYKGEALDDKSFRELLKRMDLPAHVTPHGFRASFRNWAQRAHFDNPRIDRNHRDLAEMCLGHSIKGKVEGAYWTEDALDERRVIMDAWASYCGSNSCNS